MTQINPNLSATSLTQAQIDAGKERTPEETKQPEMVSIFSQYDNAGGKDGKGDHILNYKQDSATSSYIDNGQTKKDFTSGLDKNVISKIAVNVTDLWNSAVGNFSQLYSSPDVEKSEEASAQANVDNQTKQILDNQIKLANNYIIESFEKAIQDAKAEAEKEAQAENSDDNQGNVNNENQMTLSDLESSGTKFKTRTRMVNGQKQEYIMYKDANGQTKRAIVKEDGTLDEIYDMHIVDGSGKKSFVSKSELERVFGKDANFEKLSQTISFDDNGQMRVHANGFVSNAEDAKNNGFNTVNKFVDEHPGASVKERFVNGKRDVIISYKDENGDRKYATLDKQGNIVEAYKSEGTGGMFKGVNEAAYYTSNGAGQQAAGILRTSVDVLSSLGIKVSVSHKGGGHFEYTRNGQQLSENQVKLLLKQYQ